MQKLETRKTIFIEWIFVFLLALILFASGLYIYSYNLTPTIKSTKDKIIYVDEGPHEESPEKFYNTIKSESIPPAYLYRSGNVDALKSYLMKKNSKLAENPYFDEIMTQAKNYNINPCLLFAITGREQSFVPKNHKFASKISNNPFNVFGSWEKYNTNIKDSAEIACRTIITLSKSRPANIDFIEWINKQNGSGGYAEDQMWHYDVKTFFEILNTEIY